MWDLYNVKDDFSLTNNLAAAQPAKLKEMQDLFMTEAEKYLSVSRATLFELAGGPDWRQALFTFGTIRSPP